MNPEKITYSKRLLIYFTGILLVSAGIVLCKKCNLGISPISSIPFVLEDVIPLSFGTLTMLFHLVNILLQSILGRTINLKIVLQIPIAIIFGQVINLFQNLLNFHADTWYIQILALVLSVIFTALGMVCMIHMQLIQNPPDGLVHLISQKSGKELGKVKIIYDISCVLISVAISLYFFGDIRGFGLATIVSALAVGRLVTFFTPYFFKLLK